MTLSKEQTLEQLATLGWSYDEEFQELRSSTGFIFPYSFPEAMTAKQVTAFAVKLDAYENEVAADPEWKSLPQYDELDGNMPFASDEDFKQRKDQKIIDSFINRHKRTIDALK